MINISTAPLKHMMNKTRLMEILGDSFRLERGCTRAFWKYIKL